MSRTNPRIQAQRNILHELLALKPQAENFDETATREWQRIGMGPKFYLYNGIEAYARVIERRLAQLDTEEQEWHAARSENEAQS